MINYGTLILRNAPPPPPDQPSTFIVSGVMRSGTSAVAAIVAALGIPMGDTGTVVEDPEFRDHLTNHSRGWLGVLINARNNAHLRWGFKKPDLHENLFPGEINRLFRSPRVIIPIRDVISVAIRSGGGGTNWFQNLEFAERQTNGILNFAKHLPCPVLLLSYEKLITEPRVLVQAIADFCGLPMVEAAMDTVKPNSPEYIKVFHGDKAG